jgi:cobalt-zinc-cadmium efflux system protein
MADSREAGGLLPETHDEEGRGHGAAHDHDDHDHAHGHGLAGLAVHRGGARRGLIGTLALTVTVMVVEYVGGVLTGSLALRADAGHMLTDASSLLLAVVALWLSVRPADVKRTYGYYRLEILAALLNGVALLLLAGWIGWEAVQRLRTPREIDAVGTLAIACVGLVANVAGLFLLHREKGSLNVKGAYLHLLGDTLSSVGVIASATVLVFVPTWTFLDPVVSLVIAVVVLWSAWQLIREAVDVLLEAVPAHLDLADVLHAMEDVEGVTAVHDLHIWTISSGLHALSAHVVVDSCDLGRNDEILRTVKVALERRFAIDHATLQIETPAYCSLPVDH